jgi:hypothetical protein
MELCRHFTAHMAELTSLCRATGLSEMALSVGESITKGAIYAMRDLGLVKPVKPIDAQLIPFRPVRKIGFCNSFLPRSNN